LFGYISYLCKFCQAASLVRLNLQRKFVVET
jgi:hypothetical protein